MNFICFGVFGIGDLLNNFGLVDGGLTDANGLDLIFEPLYKDDSTDAPQGGMQLGLTLSLRLSLDAQTPENSLGMINVSFNQDMIMGTEQSEDGTIQNKVLFEEDTDFLTVIIDGSNLYVDMSDITLLGMTMPKYHSSNFDIATFVDYVLSKALDNTDSVIYGDHKATEDEGSGEGTEGSEGTEGDVSAVNLAEKDEQGNWIGLSENEAMFIGVTQNDIVAIVSFTAVEAFLNLFGMNADLGNYDANIDLTISRDENKDWMQLHFVGELDPDMYYKDAKTEGWVSISDVALGRCPLARAAVDHPELKGLSLLTAPMSLPANVTPDKIRVLLDTARTMYDYILIDSPAGLGAGFRLSICGADRVLVIATNDASSLRDAQRTVEELDGIRQVHLIMNRIQTKLLRRLRATIDDAMNTAGLPLLGVVPEDAQVMLCANLGQPLTSRGKRGAALACWNIALRLEGHRVPIMRIR